MSSYFVLTINSETYLVRPGALGSSPSEHGAAADKRPSAKPAAAITAELLKKSRRFISASPPEEAVAKRFFLILVLLILQHYSANEHEFSIRSLLSQTDLSLLPLTRSAYIMAVLGGKAGFAGGTLCARILQNATDGAWKYVRDLAATNNSGSDRGTSPPSRRRRKREWTR